MKQFADAIACLTRNELDMDEVSDHYAAALEHLAEKKRKKAKDVVEPGGEPEHEEEGGAEVIDLVKVLKQRVGGTRPAPAAKRASTKAVPTAGRKR